MKRTGKDFGMHVQWFLSSYLVGFVEGNLHAKE